MLWAGICSGIFVQLNTPGGKGPGVTAGLSCTAGWTRLRGAQGVPGRCQGQQDGQDSSRVSSTG